MRDLNYEIISSGSKGNCVVIENIMIDCGVPYTKLKDSLPRVKYLFITHRHSDHLKVNTLERIHKEYPNIMIFTNADVGQWLNYQGINPYIAYFGDTATIMLSDDQAVEVFPCLHDVPCHGFIFTFDDTKVIYATDTAEITNDRGYKFDYFFIESNYDEKKLQLLAKEYTRMGYDPIQNAHRHLSTQACKAFYYINRVSPDSVLIEMHKSKRFY